MSKGSRRCLITFFLLHGAGYAQNAALRFDGVDDRLMVPSFPPLEGPFTVEAWVRPGPDGGGINPRIVELVGANDTTFRLGFGENQRGVVPRRVNFELYADGRRQDAVSTQFLGPDRWYHVAAVFDGSTQALYIDGLLEVARPAAGSLPPNTTLDIGTGAGIWTEDNDCLDGTIDEVRVWTVGRNRDEIASTMFSELSGREESLFGYWSFNEGMGEVARDWTGNGHDARLGAFDGLDEHDPEWVSEGGPVSPHCPAIGAVECRASGDGVAITWENLASWSELRVLRDGILLSRLLAGTSSYVDERPPPGEHEYALEAFAGDPSACAGSFSCDQVTCAVKVLEVFRRGDTNGDGAEDVSDAIVILLYLFLDRARPSCLDALDGNDDGRLDLSDAAGHLTFVFLRGFPPREPFPGCGLDLTADDLGCEEHTPCHRG